MQTFHFFLNILEELLDVSTMEFLRKKLLLTALKVYFSYYSAYSSQLNDSNRLSDKNRCPHKRFLACPPLSRTKSYHLEIHNMPLPNEKEITESSC